MKLVRDTSGSVLKLEMASLIDVVFLLLIYFMVTASLIRREGDLGFKLPSIAGTPPIDLPIQVFIEIEEDGAVALDGLRFNHDDGELKAMAKQLRGLKEVARSQGSVFFVNLQPRKKTKHGRVVDVMDACARAGVEHLGFVDSI